MNIHFIFAWVAVFVAAIAQIFMKLGTRATIEQQNLLKSYLNWQTLFGYTLMILATLSNMYALREVPLRDYSYILPTTFIVVLLLSFFILREKIVRKQAMGTLLIVLGIIIFNI